MKRLLIVVDYQKDFVDGALGFPGAEALEGPLHDKVKAALADGYGPYSGDPETRWDLWYMRDSPGDGVMKPGGDVMRGKAQWYLQQGSKSTC